MKSTGPLPTAAVVSRGRSSLKIPFSVYDFFGYLAAGFVVVASIDAGFEGGWLLREKHGVVAGLTWTFVAYIVGHLVAQISSAVLEHFIVRKCLRSCEETLFEDPLKTLLTRLFPGYYHPFPPETRSRVLAKAKDLAGLERPSRALFFHCHPIAMSMSAAKERLATFLNLYGFCRNVSMAAALASAIFFTAALYYADFQTPRITAECAKRLWLTLGALVVSVGMFYRYLKFFKHYTEEVFRSYAESPSPKESSDAP